MNSNSVVGDLVPPSSKKPHVVDEKREGGGDVVEVVSEEEWSESNFLRLVKRMEIYPKSTAAKEIAELMDKNISPSTARLFSKALKIAKFAFDKDKTCAKAILPLIETSIKHSSMFPKEYNFIAVFLNDVKKHADPKSFAAMAITAAIPRIAKKSVRPQSPAPPKITRSPTPSSSEARNERIRAQNTERKKILSFSEKARLYPGDFPMLKLERILLNFPKLNHHDINKPTRATFTLERNTLGLTKNGSHRIFFSIYNESKACTPLVECFEKLSVTVNHKEPLAPLRKKPHLVEYFGSDISDICNFGINEALSFAINFVKVLSVEESANDVVEKRTITRVDSLKRISDIISGSRIDESEMSELELAVSLKSPFTLTKINIPARGEKCHHINCFDLVEFLTVNKTSVKFVCPTCSASLPFSELIVDPLMQEIINESKRRDDSDIDEVIISGDGSWTLGNHEKHKAESESANPRYHYRHAEPGSKRRHDSVLTIEDGSGANGANGGDDVIIID